MSGDEHLFRELIRDYVAECLPHAEQVTADLMYVRLHGDKELYASGYDEATLRVWAAKCRDWAEQGQDVYVFFDNDAKGYAPHDAMTLLALLQQP